MILVYGYGAVAQDAGFTSSDAIWTWACDEVEVLVEDAGQVALRLPDPQAARVGDPTARRIQ